MEQQCLLTLFHQQFMLPLLLINSEIKEDVAGIGDGCLPGKWLAAGISLRCCTLLITDF